MAYNFSKSTVLAACFISIISAQAQTTAPGTKKAAQPPVAVKPVVTPTAVSKSTVDLSKSSVTATFKQTGVSAEGVFRKFSISLEYDPAKITETKAQVNVDMSSYDIGDDLFNAEVRKKEWFNSSQFPQATFVSSAVKAIGPGKLDVSGKLTIKGKSLDVNFPVTYKQEGLNTVFEGLLPIKRLSFDIGQGEWKDTSVVENEVRIKFKTTLTSK